MFRLLAPAAALAATMLLGAAPQAQAQAAPDCQGICVLGVRAATHPGFDRFVIDLGDGSIPQWVTSTQTEPLTCCGDETNEHVVPIEGKTYLKIYLSPATSFDFTSLTSLYGSPRHGLYNFPSLKGQGLTDITDPEARAFHIGLALGDHSSYRIFKLTAPNRIVVDIDH